MKDSYLYLSIMLVSLLIPLVRSFEPRIAYYRSFGSLFAAIALVGIPFIVWDSIFTAQGFWGFNERYLTGIRWFHLPLSEWLFFIIIPFVCVFIYRVLQYFFPRNPFGKYQKQISNFFIFFSAFLAVSHYDRWYTVLTFGSLFLLLAWHHYINRTTWLGDFYRTYAVILVPFLVVNGILTGTAIEEEIVWYNSKEMIGKRLFTIPVEDAFYGMVLILGVLSIYKHLEKKRLQKISTE